MSREHPYTVAVMFVVLLLFHRLAASHKLVQTNWHQSMSAIRSMCSIISTLLFVMSQEAIGNNSGWIIWERNNGWTAHHFCLQRVCPAAGLYQTHLLIYSTHVWARLLHQLLCSNRWKLYHHRHRQTQYQLDSFFCYFQLFSRTRANRHVHWV